MWPAGLKVPGTLLYIPDTQLAAEPASGYTHNVLTTSFTDYECQYHIKNKNNIKIIQCIKILHVENNMTLGLN